MILFAPFSIFLIFLWHARPTIGNRTRLEIQRLAPGQNISRFLPVFGFSDYDISNVGDAPINWFVEEILVPSNYSLPVSSNQLPPHQIEHLSMSLSYTFRLRMTVDGSRTGWVSLLPTTSERRFLNDDLLLDELWMPADQPEMPTVRTIVLVRDGRLKIWTSPVAGQSRGLWKFSSRLSIGDCWPNPWRDSGALIWESMKADMRRFVDGNRAFRNTQSLFWDHLGRVGKEIKDVATNDDQIRDTFLYMVGNFTFEEPFLRLASSVQNATIKCGQGLCAAAVNSLPQYSAHITIALMVCQAGLRSSSVLKLTEEDVEDVSQERDDLLETAGEYVAALYTAAYDYLLATSGNADQFAQKLTELKQKMVLYGQENLRVWSHIVEDRSGPVNYSGLFVPSQPFANAGITPKLFQVLTTRNSSGSPLAPQAPLVEICVLQKYRNFSKALVISGLHTRYAEMPTISFGQDEFDNKTCINIDQDDYIEKIKVAGYRLYQEESPVKSRRHRVFEKIIIMTMNGKKLIVGNPVSGNLLERTYEMVGYKIAGIYADTYNSLAHEILVNFAVSFQRVKN